MHRETRRRRVRPNSFSSDWILPRSSGRNSIRSATGTSSRHANGWSSSRRPKPRSLSLPGSSTKDAPWHFSPGCLSGGRCPDYRQPLPRLGDRIPRVQPPGGDLEPCRRRGIGRLRIRSARLPAPRVSRPPLADTDVDGLGFTVQPKKTFELELTRPEDEIWAGFKSTCRTAIRKAQKSGVIVEQAMAQRSRTSTTLSSTTSSRVNRCRPPTAPSSCASSLPVWSRRTASCFSVRATPEANRSPRGYSRGTDAWRTSGAARVGVSSNRCGPTIS